MRNSVIGTDFTKVLFFLATWGGLSQKDSWRWCCEDIR